MPHLSRIHWFQRDGGREKDEGDSNKIKPKQNKKTCRLQNEKFRDCRGRNFSHCCSTNSHSPGLKEHNQFVEVKEALPPGQVQRQRVTRSNQKDLTSATFPPQCLAHHQWQIGYWKARGCLFQLAMKIRGFKWPQILQRGGSTVPSLLTGPPPHPPPLR